MFSLIIFKTQAERDDLKKFKEENKGKLLFPFMISEAGIFMQPVRRRKIWTNQPMKLGGNFVKV
jgi:hypothetical protein